jgi:hypothetical protein
MPQFKSEVSSPWVVAVVHKRPQDCKLVGLHGGNSRSRGEDTWAMCVRARGDDNGYEFRRLRAQTNQKFAFQQ